MLADWRPAFPWLLAGGLTPENVAEASVSYEGDGPLTRNQKRGFLGTLVDIFIHNFWPL